ncbi:MAG: 4-vinyl reductase [Candidatus Pacearchaeota archaeon]
MLSPLLKKLLFVRQFSIDNGKINILGNRHVMLSDDVLLELQEIDDVRLYSLIKDSTLLQLSKFVEHAKVYKQLKEVVALDISTLSKKISSNEGIIKTIQDIFDIYGLGKMIIASLDNTKKQAVVRIYESVLAETYLKKNKKRAEKAVCAITAAVIAGIFSYVFGKKVDAIEEKCKAKNGDYCEFIIK